jgi:hypothetical protein
MEKLVAGRIVHYVLSESDAKEINHDREAYPCRKGNFVSVGQTYPMIIVRVWESESAGSGVNGQVILDGNDSYWACSRPYDPGGRPGTWHWSLRE